MKRTKRTVIQWVVGAIIIYVLWTILHKMSFHTIFFVNVPFCWLAGGLLVGAYMLWFFVFRKRR